MTNCQKKSVANQITPQQLGIMLVIYILGDSIVFVNTPNDPQHGWLAYIIASIGGFLILAVYLKIYKLNDLKPLPAILKNCFGKYVGAFLSILYSLFFMYNASLVSYNYTAYLIETSYDYTPKWFILLLLGCIALYALYKGVKVIARASEIFIFIIPLSIIAVSILGFKTVHLNYIHPIYAINYFPILKDAFYPFSLSFGVCVAFLMLFPLAGNTHDIQKPLYISMGIISCLLTFFILRTLLIMGGSMINRYVYTIFFSYSISDPIKLGILAASFLGLSVLIKILILLYSSITILTSVFNIKKSSPVILVVVVVTHVLSYFSFNTGISIHEFFQNIWVYFISDFAVCIPIIMLSISLIKKSLKHKSKKT